MIRMFCKELPRTLSQLLYNEYQVARKGLDFLLETYPQRYKWVDDPEIIRLLLALSIFYRRVIAQLESAMSFSRRLFKSNVSYIEIGVDQIDHDQVEKMSKTVRDFYGLLKGFSISVELFDYYDSREFLSKVKQYKDFLEKEQD